MVSVGRSSSHFMVFSNKFLTMASEEVGTVNDEGNMDVSKFAALLKAEGRESDLEGVTAGPTTDEAVRNQSGGTSVLPPYILKMVIKIAC